MMSLASDVIEALRGKQLVTAESCTGGGIGATLTGVAGSSSVYKGGIISYTNWVKHHVLGVPQTLLDTVGAVSAPVAEAMAAGARRVLEADIAVSVTGLAGTNSEIPSARFLSVIAMTGLPSQGISISRGQGKRFVSKQSAPRWL